MLTATATATVTGTGSSGKKRVLEKVTCGKPIIREMTMQQGCSDEDCHRRFLLYVPSSVCEDETSTTVTFPLPLVFTVHCLGCSMETFHHWMEIAEQYQFVWVNPEGLHNSFNAGDESCCGYALENGIDDKAYFRSIIEQLSTQYESSFVSSQWVYGMGWSNGGYMVSAAADLFRAVAPIAGYQIEKLPLQHPTAIFLHHSYDDPFVQPTGCCTDPTMPRCCCHLSSYLDVCVSVESQLDRWAINNGCSAVSSTITTLHHPDEVTCYTYEQCHANTTFCIHQHKGHFNRPSFEVAFGYSNHIADFFAQHMCVTANSDAIWDGSQKVCRCTDPSGPFCFHSRTSPPNNVNHINDTGYKISQDDTTTMITRNALTENRQLVTIMMFLLLGMGLAIWYKRNNRMPCRKRHLSSRRTSETFDVELSNFRL